MVNKACKLFIDTWGWLCIWDNHQKRHEEVSDYYNSILKGKHVIFTTDFVLDETFTLLFKRLPYENAIEFVEIISESKKGLYLNVEKIDDERFEKSISLRKKYNDKPDISFTDLTSMVIMKELEINKILTGDAHFHHVGLGFQIVP